MDAVIVCFQQRVKITQKNLYAIDVDRRKKRNCYNCGKFGYMVRNCRNRGVGSRIGEGRRPEYRRNENNEQRRIEGRNRQNNLNGEGDLVVLD